MNNQAWLVVLLRHDCGTRKIARSWARPKLSSHGPIALRISSLCGCVRDYYENGNFGQFRNTAWTQAKTQVLDASSSRLLWSSINHIVFSSVKKQIVTAAPVRPGKATFVRLLLMTLPSKVVDENECGLSRSFFIWEEKRKQADIFQVEWGITWARVGFFLQTIFYVFTTRFWWIFCL